MIKAVCVAIFGAVTLAATSLSLDVPSIVACGKPVVFSAEAWDSTGADISSDIFWDNGERGALATYRFPCGQLGPRRISASVVDSSGAVFAEVAELAVIKEKKSLW